MDKCIYLDNNATTMMPQVVKNEMTKWFNCGNASADDENGIKCRTMMRQFREKLAEWCKIKLAKCGNYKTTTDDENKKKAITAVFIFFGVCIIIIVGFIVIKHYKK
ncbi:MAG TPA: aminotransferase class V-fold PLP-dependent enzyme [Bacteroidales bacterium]|nr:aminotransferase class V-fold PLP-dependent enzyme [Bacteroidales bacterium]